MPRYQEQYQCAKRYYERLKRIKDGLGSTCDTCQDPNHIEDYMRSFFIHCYHIKDWIQKDHAAPSSMRDRVWSFIKCSSTMKLCTDLCNGIKHLERDRKPMSPEQPTFPIREHTIEVTETVRATDSVRVNDESVSEPSPSEPVDKPPVSHIRFWINDGGKRLDPFTVAAQAMESWETFIRENGGDC